MSIKRKRRLTDEEITEIQEWMAGASQGNKPTIRQIARRYGVNQPSVLKSLEGWDGIRRGKPDEKKHSEFIKEIMKAKDEPAIMIEGYTSDVKPEDIRV